MDFSGFSARIIPTTLSSPYIDISKPVVSVSNPFIGNLLFLYSHRRLRKDLYLEYLRVQTTLESSKMKTQQNSEWVDGVFSVVIHG